VRVRAPRADDQPEFLAAVERSRASHQPWSFPPDSPQLYREYLAKVAADDCEGFLIEAPDGGLAGFATISQIVRAPLLSGYLGYTGFEPYMGQGLMRQGLIQILDHAFGLMGLHRIEANVQPGNERSIALVQRLGLRREGFSPRYLMVGGVWRDHERYAITAEEWPPAGLSRP
jgi:[ribosomal protein S5]-alanine N-acetyltransferase